MRSAASEATRDRRAPTPDATNLQRGATRPWRVPPVGPTCAGDSARGCRRHHIAKPQSSMPDPRPSSTAGTSRSSDLPVYPTTYIRHRVRCPNVCLILPDEDDEAGDFWAGDDALSGLDWDSRLRRPRARLGCHRGLRGVGMRDDSGNDNPDDLDDRDGRGDFGSFDDLVTYLFDPTTGRNDPVRRVRACSALIEGCTERRLDTRLNKLSGLLWVVLPTVSPLTIEPAEALLSHGRTLDEDRRPAGCSRRRPRSVRSCGVRSPSAPYPAPEA